MIITNQDEARAWIEKASEPDVNTANEAMNTKQANMKARKDPSGYISAIVLDGKLEVHFFDLTEQHLKLIQRLSIYQVFHHEYPWTVPDVGFKRPYGNSDVYGDIGEILGIEPAGEEVDDDYREYSDQQIAEMLSIHNEVSVALSICTQTMTFQTGLYVRNSFISEWLLLENNLKMDIQLREIYEDALKVVL